MVSLSLSLVLFSRAISPHIVVYVVSHVWSIASTPASKRATTITNAKCNNSRSSLKLVWFSVIRLDDGIETTSTAHHIWFSAFISSFFFCSRLVVCCWLPLLLFHHDSIYISFSISFNVIHFFYKVFIWLWIKTARQREKKPTRQNIIVCLCVGVCWKREEKTRARSWNVQRKYVCLDMGENNMW